MIDLSVILPVHNESANIIATIEAITDELMRASITYEVICVENGSTDDTLAQLTSYARNHDHVHVIQSPIGWGNAVRAGIGKCTGRYACYMVSDGQVDAKYIVELYKLTHLYTNSEIYGMFKIWRTTRENPLRFINSRIYNVLSWVLFGVRSRDVNATPKVLSTELLKSMNLTSPNIALDLELLLRLKKRGIQWMEIPAVSKKRESGVSTTNFKAVREMITYMLKFRFGGGV